jgi:hypothetical protein
MNVTRAVAPPTNHKYCGDLQENKRSRKIRLGRGVDLLEQQRGHLFSQR